MSSIVRRTYNRSNLAQKEYFQSIIEAMKDKGFEFLAWVTIDSHQFPYFLNCYTYVRNSRLFLYAPGKSLIVCLSCNEYFSSDENPLSSMMNKVTEDCDANYYRRHWSAEVFMNHMLPRRVHPDKMVGAFLSNSGLYDPVGGTSTTCSNGSSQNQLCLPLEASRDKNITIDQLVAPFGDILKEYKDVMYDHFDELFAFSFAPYHTFRGSQSAFWRVFPQRRLKKLADIIWGTK